MVVDIQHKKNLADKFEEYLDSYKSCIVLQTANINNNEIIKCKREFEGAFDCKFLHGKKKSFAKRLNEKGMSDFAKELKGDTILLFTNDSVLNACQRIGKFSKRGKAVFNRPAQVDYTLEAQVTSLSNDATRFFQKLRIPTKLTKGNVEITQKFQILTAGKNVEQAQVDVLNAMNIAPYVYHIELKAVYTCKQMANPSIYSMSVDNITDCLKCAFGNAQALSHGAAIPTESVSKACVSKALEDCLAFSAVLSENGLEPSSVFKAKIDLLSDPEALKKLQEAAAGAVKTETVAAAKEEAQDAEESESEEVEEIDMDF